MRAENMVGADLTIEFDPGRVSLEDLAEGGLLSRDGTGVTMIQSIDRERGLIQVSLDRPAGAGGVSGEGPILALRLTGPGSDGSGLRIGEVRIRTARAPATEPVPVEEARVITNR
jgi:hypothetical protein